MFLRYVSATLWSDVGLVVAAPSLRAFKARLDAAVGSLGLLVGDPARSRGWNGMSIAVLCDPGRSTML